MLIWVQGKDPQAWEKDRGRRLRGWCESPVYSVAWTAGQGISEIPWWRQHDTLPHPTTVSSVSGRETGCPRWLEKKTVKQWPHQSHVDPTGRWKHDEATTTEKKIINPMRRNQRCYLAWDWEKHPEDWSFSLFSSTFGHFTAVDCVYQVTLML